MLSIRFQRIGRKKSPSYRLVLSENARDTQGRALEILGHYNPVATPKIVELNTERIKYWLALGTTASEAVHNLFVREGILTGEKKKAVSISKKRQGKIDAVKNAAVEAKRKAEEAAKAAKEAAAAEALAAKEAAEAEAKAAAEAPAEVPTEFTQGGSDSVGEVAPVAEEPKAE